jgi:hypothetical protein
MTAPNIAFRPGSLRDNSGCYYYQSIHYGALITLVIFEPAMQELDS